MATSNGATSPPALGRYVRMRALKPAELPPHPDLAPQQVSGTPPDLREFIAEVLKEAEDFMTGYLPQKFKVKDSNKRSPPSAASVELLSHNISASDLPKDTRSAGAESETWFARKSVHENAAKEGTATWEEFDGGLRADHSQHEMEYTPDVQEAHKVLDWDSRLQSVDRKVGGWEDVSMSIVEMRHHIPPPLRERVFPELVLTAKRAEELIVVQIPVDIAGMPGAKFNSKDSKVQLAMYCSIEHGQLVDDGKKVVWRMGTASDAKGILPMWAQKMGVPGAIVKDVGLFIDWCAKRRKGAA